MKHGRQLFVILCILFATHSVFAQSAKRLHPVDVRSVSLGTIYYTDTETVYSLFSNPASIAFTGDTFLWPPLVSVVTGGELFDVSGEYFFKPYALGIMLQEGTEGSIDPTNPESLKEYENFFNEINNFIGKDGYTASVRVGGPLTFGAIKNNFGWGVVNTIDVEAKLNVDGTLISFDIPKNLEDLNSLLEGDIPEIPSLESITKEYNLDLVTTADINFDAVVGYAVPFDFGLLGELSFGLSARAITQFSFLYQDDLKTLFFGDGVFEADNILSQIPAAFSVGFGIDLGVQYEFLNMVNVALVWQDVFSPVWTNSLASVRSFTSLFDGTGSGYVYNTLNSQLGLGASVDIPLENLTGNVISHAAAYANYNDFLQLIRNAEKQDDFYRDPLLDLAVGAEIIFYETVALRVGMNQLFPSGGIGLYLGNFKIDFSVHNEELGHSAEDWKQLNFGLSVTIQE